MNETTAVQAAPSNVRRAVEWLEREPLRPYDAAAVADASRLSLRGLQAAFQREFGITPREYSRRLRFDQARRLLRELDPADGATVREVAFGLGFRHPGRFAHEYECRFGESPSRTLRY